MKSTHYLLKLFFALKAMGLASAYHINYPDNNEIWARGSNQTIKWSSSDTDPSMFSIYLVNFADFPPQNIKLASGIHRHVGYKQVQIPSDIKPSYGYHINFIMDDNVYVIYASSTNFTVSRDIVADVTKDTIANGGKLMLNGTRNGVGQAEKPHTVWVRVPIVKYITTTVVETAQVYNTSDLCGFDLTPAADDPYVLAVNKNGRTGEMAEPKATVAIDPPYVDKDTGFPLPPKGSDAKAVPNANPAQPTLGPSGQAISASLLNAAPYETPGVPLHPAGKNSTGGRHSIARPGNDSMVIPTNASFASRTGKTIPVSTSTQTLSENKVSSAAQIFIPSAAMTVLLVLLSVYLELL